MRQMMQQQKADAAEANAIAVAANDATTKTDAARSNAIAAAAADHNNKNRCSRNKMQQTTPQKQIQQTDQTPIGAAAADATTKPMQPKQCNSSSSS
jgi:endonuclease/exonuclease/phosphatase (EEP) superfamily protein YafD